MKTKKQIRVGLIIDGFFGGANTQYGGYGKLARDYICKYLSKQSLGLDIIVDVILGTSSRKMLAKKYVVDGINLYRLPKSDFFAKRFLKRKNYDIYLSIELVDERVLLLEKESNKKLILWIQDPRPWYEWEEINTVRLLPEECYYRQEIYDTVHDWYKRNKIVFVSQAEFLNKKAIDLYNLGNDVPIKYLPNPIEIDYTFDVSSYEKKDKIIFLGRIDSVKRGWLFCEIAKQLPEYDFFVLGKYQHESDRMKSILEEYNKLPNLTFVGHVDGDVKTQFLKDAKILVNTSIHEALPVSFLEALSYGTLIVSNRNPDNLTEMFGIWTGDILGDGWDKVSLYTQAIKKIIEDEPQRKKLSKNAIEYINNIHNIEKFQKNIVDIIKSEIT
ncbi:glycoside hydrolase [Ignatzschineria indica]|uniref:Glycosyl transferase n=1 Tax=Ignatzschineria indica TaxID=472583 RepID=A0A2U2AIZ5_9GAMM|nr:glycosyltransferase family 4 protein [Ignatzschineria indica]PWD82623.1 glycosyl transferase [Ignatzschineria indica]GGZ85377.1 glycoside hydrolase [Ignatzschineria indica]